MAEEPDDDLVKVRDAVPAPERLPEAIPDRPGGPAPARPSPVKRKPAAVPDDDMVKVQDARPGRGPEAIPARPAPARPSPVMREPAAVPDDDVVKVQDARPGRSPEAIPARPQRGLVKHQLPAELRTREWGRVPLWVRERSFFMAGVAKGEVLQVFHDVSQEMASGKMGLAAGRERVRAELAKLGYIPEPGQEGTIKDLMSAQRINVALETNVRMIKGWAAHRKQGLAVGAYPAVQLVRLKRVEVPRGWARRWEEARQGLGGLEGEATAVAPGDLKKGEDSAGQMGMPLMAAVYGCPIFPGISRFNAPYAPYDFNSGIGTRAVSRKEAQAWGLDPARAAAYAAEGWQSPGHDLRAEPRITKDEIRDAVVDSLGGLAKVDEDGAIVFTDPNGTRPSPVSELVELLRKPNVDGTRNYQAEAAERMAEGTLRDGTDLMDDMGRLVRRIAGAGVDVKPGVQVRVERFRNEAARALRRQTLQQPGGVPLMMGTLSGAGDYGLVIRTRGAVEMGKLLGREEGLVSVGPFEVLDAD